MGLREMLKPASKGDMLAAVGVLILLIGVVIGSITEDLWAMIVPLGMCFALLIAGIKMDDLEKKGGRMPNKKELIQLRKKIRNKVVINEKEVRTELGI